MNVRFEKRWERKDISSNLSFIQIIVSDLRAMFQSTGKIAVGKQALERNLKFPYNSYRTKAWANGQFFV